MRLLSKPSPFLPLLLPLPLINGEGEIFFEKGLALFSPIEIVPEVIF